MADDGESVMGDGTADRGEQFTAPNRPVMSGPMLIIDRSIDRPTGQSPFFAPPGPGPVPTVPDSGPGQNANKFGEAKGWTQGCENFAGNVRWKWQAAAEEKFQGKVFW